MFFLKVEFRERFVIWVSVIVFVKVLLIYLIKVRVDVSWCR